MKNIDLKHCKLTIPILENNNTFEGSYLIDNENFHFWIHLSETSENHTNLFKLIKKGDLFTTIIESSDICKNVFTCFKCYSFTYMEEIQICIKNKYTQEIRPRLNELNISMDRNSWIENGQFNDISDKLWNKVSFYFPFSESCFFSGERTEKISLSEKETI